MKKLIIAFLVSVPCWVYSQTILWTEDFAAEANNDTNGVAGGTPGGTWSVTTLPTGGAASFSRQSLFGLTQFRADQTGTEGVWQSNVIDITSTGMVTISIDMLTVGTNSADYMRAYYRVDGGAEVLFAELLGSIANASTTASAIVSGSSVQIVIRAIENTAGDFFGVPFAFSFDNLSVTTVPVVYSRKNGTWTDATAGNGTWSAVSLGGVSCDCAPTAGQVAIIGNGNTVTLPSSQSVGGVDIKNTGVFQFNTNATGLTVVMGLFRVESGGAVNSSGAGITGEQIIFNEDIGGANFQVDAGGTAAFQDLVLSSLATNLHYISGGGNLTLSGDILINASGATLMNNLTTTINASRILFGTSGTITGSIFTNTGSIILSSTLGTNNNNDDNNIVNNSAGATLNLVNVDALESGAANGADLQINNSGTINQSGTFVDIPNTASSANSVNNLAGAVWNYSGTGHDTDVRLFANNGTNDFSYTRAGAQSIISPRDGYSNINLQTSGAKTALANFNVYGNWSSTGTATFAPAGFTVTFSGTAAQSISAVAGETFAGLTINNTFVTSPQVTFNNPVTVTGTLTMTLGNVNLNGNTLTLGASPASPGTLSHAGSSANGWLYGGTFTRYMRASNATTIGGGDQNEGFFPLGSSADFRPFFIGKNNNAGTGGSISVTHNNATTTSDVNIPDTAPVATITRRHDSNWAVTTSGITGGTWALRAGGTNFGTIQEVADIRLCTTAGVVGTNSVATGGPTDWRVNRTGLTFGELTNAFHLASTDALNSPLPIVLTYFKASVVEDDAISLEWETSQEINNAYFTVERTTDLEGFENVLVLEGKGNSNTVQYYKVLDNAPHLGRSYYRLRQTDFDGRFTYSNVVRVDVENTGPSMKVFSNPVQNEAFVVEMRGLQAHQLIPVRIINTQGGVVYENTFEADQAGAFTKEIPFDQPSGLYILKAGRDVRFTHKIVVE